jgi:regulator of protease activity HflC (stomatin/prohibitin superfamily)
VSISIEFILAVLFALAAVAAVLIGKMSSEADSRAMAFLAMLVTGGLSALFLLFACAYTVPVRNVGIVTSFNAPTGRTTGSGLKFVLPWQRVADFDASIQTADHTGADKCTTVRIGSLATACVENRIQWQVLATSAPRLFNDYRGDFDNMRRNLVETRIQTALNSVFATYNPLSQVNLSTGQVGFDGAALGTAVEAELNRVIGSDIRILTVAVPLVHHDAQTEANIRQFQDVIAQSRLLDQKAKNAAKEKAIADLQRAYLTDAFITNKCIEESVKMGVPPGLCMLSSGLVSVPTGKS